MKIPDDLTEAERLLWDEMQAGELRFDFVSYASEERDPSNGEHWGGERTLRGEALTEILTHRYTASGVPMRATYVRLARISGELNLQGLELAGALIFDSCFFENEVNVSGARLAKLELNGCYLPRLDGRQLQTRGDLSLMHLRAEAVDLPGARIGGVLNLQGANLKNADETTLFADGAHIDEDMYCAENFQTEGQMRLIGAVIGGQLNLNGARLQCPGGIAFYADGAQIAGGMFCRGGLETDGEMRMLGANIGGQLSMSGAYLKNTGGTAFAADGAQIAGGLFCRDNFRTDGAFVLSNVHIDGQLNLLGAHLKHPGDYALSADGAQIAGHVICKGGFQADGEIWLLGASIGGQLQLQGAHLRNPTGDALTINGGHVAEHILCLDGFEADGSLSLSQVHVGGRLDLSDAILKSSVGVTVDLSHAAVTHLLLPTKHSPQGIIDLTHARITHLEDAWPTNSYTARIVDLTYDTLSPLDSQTVTRLDWVSKAEGGFRPQPYEQLASLLRREGHDDDARKVAIAKEKARLKTLRRPARLLSRFLGATVGYGYNPAQGIWWLTGLFLLNWIVFAWAKVHGHFRAIHDKAQDLPQFHVSLYALDHVLPIIELGQRSYWSATGFFQYWQTASDLAGWLLATVILGAVTARLVRS